jgi:hypothetical protein
MIKKIYYLSVSIMSVGFLLNTNSAYANANCTTDCQENMCRHSPDLAAICYEECPQARACHLAAFDEFRKLHEQTQRSKKRYTRNKLDVTTEIAPETSTLTKSIDNRPSIETSSEIPIPLPIDPTADVSSSNINKMPETLLDQIRAGKQLNPPADRVPSKAWKDKVSDSSENHVSE